MVSIFDNENEWSVQKVVVLVTWGMSYFAAFEMDMQGSCVF